ncbi:hypothetical protein CYMTET_6121 [Cymbomonas tetramitiformis]|uniref:Uncharacterized protein n=1 Tax=Cymbomonas tetramitiformis TaxID=36881 RepID=A0AAE0GXW4_9CHLO|nr:hypothetical protein CYMTET_6121 [Cymbomonas tetramitiformis]
MSIRRLCFIRTPPDILYLSTAITLQISLLDDLSRPSPSSEATAIQISLELIKWTPSERPMPTPSPLKEIRGECVEDGMILKITSDAPRLDTSEGSFLQLDELTGECTFQLTVASTERSRWGWCFVVARALRGNQGKAAGQILPIIAGPIRLLNPESEAAKNSSRMRSVNVGWARRLSMGEEGPPLLVMEESGDRAEISGSTWDAGIVLGAFLAKWWRQNCQEGGDSAARVGHGLAVELGCGCGVAGLGLAQAMQRSGTGRPGSAEKLDLVLTDLDEARLMRDEAMEGTLQLMLEPEGCGLGVGGRAMYPKAYAVIKQGGKAITPRKHASIEIGVGGKGDVPKEASSIQIQGGEAMYRSMRY